MVKAQDGGDGGRRMRMSPDQMDPQKMAERTASKMKEKIGLDANQETTVQALALERFLTMKEAFGKARESGDMAAMRPAMEEAEKKFDQDVRAILKKDQIKAYEEWREEQKQRMLRMQERVGSMGQ